MTVSAVLETIVKATEKNTPEINLGFAEDEVADLSGRSGDTCAVVAL